MLATVAFRPTPRPSPGPAQRRPAPRRPAESARRRRAFEFGMSGERSVAAFLRAGDYRILGTRVRIGQAEVDLIAVREDVVAFVEVKTRRRAWDGLASVTPAKIRKVSRAANAWLAANDAFAGCSIRFDIALVERGGSIEYLENAFEAAADEDFVF